MTKTPRIFIALVAFAALANLQANEVATEGAEAGMWTQDYASAAALAKEKGLPILLNFTGSDWCGWCKIMDGNVYAKPEWEAFAAKNLVLVTVDFPKDKTIVPEKYVGRNNELKGKFGVRGYPTYILLDSDGETKLGQLGAGKEKTPESFIEEVESVLQFRQASIDAKVAELGDAKGGEYLAAIEALRSKEAGLKEWLGTKPQRNDENNKKFADFNESIAEARAKLDSF